LDDKSLTLDIKELIPMLMTLVTAKKIADGFVYDVRDIVKKNIKGDDA
tara:strand:- start:470 stop:613 length:144 start_codon:yes stop_codon:yes gene_type:complete